MRLFAMLREQAGADSVELELSEGATGADAVLNDGDELALIPPVSGG